MSQRKERRGIHVDQSELHCNKGCGYYGNAAWQGLCSKCWREEYQRARQKQIQEDWALAEKLVGPPVKGYNQLQCVVSAVVHSFSPRFRLKHMPFLSGMVETFLHHSFMWDASLC